MSNKLINGQVISAVYQIIASEGTGTAFEVKIKDEFYLITAAHCITKNDIYYVHEKQPKKLDYEWKKKHEHADVAIIKLKKQLHGQIPLPDPKSILVTISEQVFFLGFPYQMSGAGAAELNLGFSVPFIKSGIVSAIDENKERFYIDAHNNPGFSGGPVIQVDEKGNPRVIGIINGFVPENKAFGFENTGICIATRITLALDLLN